MKNDELSPIFIAAHLWQSRGWQVVPVQPNSKRLVAGFGIYQNKADSGEKVRFWFQDRNSNLAVIVPPGGVILDFDQLDPYFEFCKLSPDLAGSYTESTPRGGRHVFLRTSAPIPPGLVLSSGIEIKQISLVYPSKIKNKYYRLINPGDIKTGNVLEAVKSFISPEEHNSPASRVIRFVGRPVLENGDKKADSQLLEKIKAAWPILDYLKYFEPRLLLTGRGRWLAGRCPWHDDLHPSLWVDTERNLWGCHGCKAHGDILNWHAMRIGARSIGDAIRDLASYKVEVGK